MKSAVLEQLNSPLAIRDLYFEALRYGQVLVKITTSGICGAQLQEIDGHKGNASFLPHLLGHEGCGWVQDVGVGVTNIKPGDKVILHWRKGAGIEAPNPSYHTNYSGNEPMRTIGAGKVTTFSEFAVVSENRVTRVDPDTPEELCALLGCSLSTALGTIESEARVKFGESVLIIGCGGLGVNLIRAAKMAQAYPIVVTDINLDKKETALAMGADMFIADTFVGALNYPTPQLPNGFDVVIDTSGHPVAIADAIPLLGPSGRMIMVGHPQPGQTVLMHDPDHMFGGEGKTIKATQGGGFRPHIDIPRYVRMWKAGLLKIDDIVTHRISLDEVNDGLDLVRAGHASRVMIKM